MTTITAALDTAAVNDAALLTAIAGERTAILASIPAKALATDVLAGTNDATYITPKKFVDALNGSVAATVFLAGMLTCLLPSLDARYTKLALLAPGATFYVNGTLGNDGNDGLGAGAGRAFATAVGAAAAIASRYIAPGIVTVNVADGTFNGITLSQSFVSAWRWVGNHTTPANCVLAAPNGTVNAGRSVIVYRGVTATFDGFSFTSLYENVAVSGGTVTLLSCTYSLTASNYAITMFVGGSLFMGGAINITGSAALGFIIANQSSTAQIATSDPAAGTVAATITLTGTPAFSLGFAVADLSSTILFLPSVITIVGSATGPRFFAGRGGSVNVLGAGANYLPGNAAGTYTGGYSS
jgi:hypothetical protein